MKALSCIALSAFSLLAACGGTGPTSTNTGNGPHDVGGASYPELTNSSVSSTSTLGGTTVATDGTVSNVTGTFTHNTGEVRFFDGTVLVTDLDGGTGLTGLESGDVTVSIFAGDGFTETLEYMTPVTITAPVGSGSAIIGLVTDVSDVPSSATAVYTGQTSINVANGSGTFLMTGNATTRADFGAGRVDVSLTDFNTTPTPAPFDRLNIDNMAISGQGFTGGTLTASTGGTTVTPLDGSPTLSSRGTFFGFDTQNQIPAEVGGGFRADGTSNDFISGIYTGD